LSLLEASATASRTIKQHLDRIDRQQHTMPTAYKVDIAKDRRAGCMHKECKDNKVKFEPGELRFAVWTEIMEHGSWKYRHW
jgi:hypothetical protein